MLSTLGPAKPAFNTSLTMPLRCMIGAKFVTKTEWLPQSPDANPLDNRFWNAVNEKVYEGRRQLFGTIQELKGRIVEVWNEVLGDGTVIRQAVTQFRPRLQVIVWRNGYLIEADFV